MLRLISCLVLFHPTITSLTKCFLLRSKFVKYEFEIEVIGNHTVIIYLWNISKINIWQAILNIEMMDIRVGYGFGNKKKDAEKTAFDRLKTIKKELGLLTGER